MGMDILPISVDRLLSGRIVENSRIEYNRSWNPLKILHTVCAFANDYDNIGGGYIIIGIEEVDGVPVSFPGVTSEEIAIIDRELMRLCNLISPRYVPLASQETYRGAQIYVIWVPAGNERPYKCPISLGKGSTEGAYFIRRLSNTVRVNQDEEISLIKRTSRTPFDNQININARIGDIQGYLVESYLADIGSKMELTSYDYLDVYRSIRIVRGPPEFVKPVNVGLLFFSKNPEQFFPGAHSELTRMENDAGDLMDDIRYIGPLNVQISRVIEYFQSKVLSHRIRKVSDRAESEHYFNYPLEAIEEIVVNAFYHKDYEIDQPVKIRIHPDRIEVFNCPGPDPSISNADIAAYRFRREMYLNSRIGDFLKEMGLAESRNTGIPRAIAALKANGSDLPIFETDDKRSFMRVTIPIHRDFLDSPADSHVEVRYRAPDEIKEMILEDLRRNGCSSSAIVSQRIGYSSVNNTFRRCVRELMDEGLLEYLYPDRPRDRRQRICLSRKH